jgi:curved DNA-binding protein CbpA
MHEQANYYDVLGVPSTASVDEIRRRYKFLVIAFHPDRFLRTPEHHSLAEQRLKQVNEAYRVLSDPQARAQYDLLQLAADASRTLWPGGPSRVPGGGLSQPFVTQLQNDLANALAQTGQLEQEVAAWRERYEQQSNERAALQQAHAEVQRTYQQERQTLEAAIEQATRRLEQLVRERASLEARLKEQANKSSRKTAKLEQDLATQERLVENLAATKAEWERSNLSRFDLLTQQVRKLQEDVKRRDASLAQQKQTQRGLEERLAAAEREARLAAQNMAAALRVKQQEADALRSEQAAGETEHVRERKAVRLWQIAAIIAILNTLLLLGLLLARL